MLFNESPSEEVRLVDVVIGVFDVVGRLLGDVSRLVGVAAGLFCDVVRVTGDVFRLVDMAVGLVVFVRSSLCPVVDGLMIIGIAIEDSPGADDEATDTEAEEGAEASNELVDDDLSVVAS